MSLDTLTTGSAPPSSIDVPPGEQSVVLRLWDWLRGHGALLCILALQTALTFRFDNTAFQDEATYLYSGHRQLDLWLHGIPTHEQYSTYFSGLPFLYPVLGGLIDGAVGLEAVRACSLLFSLVTTVLLYLVAVRLYDRTVALAGSATFAVSVSTLFNGYLATYDAAALMLVAFAVWIGVRTAHFLGASIVLAAPVLVLAGLTKYAAILYLPPAVAVIAIAVARDRGLLRAIVTCAALIAVTGSLLWSVFLVNSELAQGFVHTTMGRSPGSDDPVDVGWAAVRYIGLPVLLVLIGAVILVGRNAPASLAGAPRYTRILLAITCVCTVLAAPANQVHLHTLVSLHKHVGYGLWFAAPLAGVALAQLLRRKSFRGFTAATAAGAVMAWSGLTHAETRYQDWPHSDAIVATLQTMVRPVTGRYLVEEHEVPRYYLRALTEPYQWIGTSSFEYDLPDGGRVQGRSAYEAAIRDGYFDAVALRYGPTKELDVHLAELLNANRSYKLVAEVPLTTSFGDGTWEVWRRD